MYTRIKTDEEIQSMRKAGEILRTVLGILKKQANPGVSTQELADIAYDEIKKRGGEPAFLNYGYPVPFPAAVCISVNDEVVHGVPRVDKVLANGDIVSCDLGVSIDGMITDSAISFVCGDSSKEKDFLLSNTKKSLNEGLSAVKDGCRVGDISYRVQKVLDKASLGIVRDLVGHGVGHEVHEDPNIPNFGKKGSGPKLVAGMTIAVEPMATLGNYGVYIDDDKWTVKTNDGSLSAHFEHTVLITKSGYEILT